MTTDLVKLQTPYVRDLVERARYGDQNAMATIGLVKESADKGSPRAKVAYTLLKTYIEEHPFTRHGESDIGAEAREAVSEVKDHTQQFPSVAPDLEKLVAIPVKGGNEGMLALCGVLVNGPPLTNEWVRQVGDMLPSDEMRLTFFYGVVRHEDAKELQKDLPPDGRICLVLGRCIGFARAVQYVRRPGSDVSKVSSRVGWELT